MILEVVDNAGEKSMELDDKELVNDFDESFEEEFHITHELGYLEFLKHGILGSLGLLKSFLTSPFFLFNLIIYNLHHILNSFTEVHLHSRSLNLLITQIRWTKDIVHESFWMESDNVIAEQTIYRYVKNDLQKGNQLAEKLFNAFYSESGVLAGITESELADGVRLISKPFIFAFAYALGKLPYIFLCHFGLHFRKFRPLSISGAFLSFFLILAMTSCLVAPLSLSGVAYLVLSLFDLAPLAQFGITFLGKVMYIVYEYTFFSLITAKWEDIDALLSPFQEYPAFKHLANLFRDYLQNLKNEDAKPRHILSQPQQSVFTLYTRAAVCISLPFLIYWSFDRLANRRYIQKLVEEEADHDEETSEGENEEGISEEVVAESDV